MLLRFRILGRNIRKIIITITIMGIVIVMSGIRDFLIIMEGILGNNLGLRKGRKVQIIN